MIGIKITFKTGSPEWIDPVTDQYEKDGVLYVNNGYHLYEYQISNIVNTENYDTRFLVKPETP